MLKTKMVKPTASAYEYPLLIKQILLSGPRYEPQQEIVYRDLFRYTYGELYERICRLANALTKAGVRPGDTVAVLEWDSHRYLECMFAIPMIGAIIHTVNIRLSPEQILYTMNHADDKLVLVHDDFVPLMAQIKDKLNTVEGFWLLTDKPSESKHDNLSSQGVSFQGEYEALLAESETTYNFPDFDEHSVATTFYTTGTTGNPKGVYFTHRQIVLHTLVISLSLGSLAGQPLMNSGDTYMPITPMFHVHAWGVPYAATMMGTKQVYPGRYEPDLLIKLQQQEKVSFSHCVPTIVNMLLNSEAAKQADLSGWRILIGGSALTKGLTVAAREKGVILTGAYGLSETCPLLSVAYLNEKLRDLPEDEQIDFRIKTGIPAPLVELAIVDEEGNDLAHDGQQVGEIVCRAPWLTQGYLKEENGSEALWRDGWLHTGDVATIDALGFIQITDRIKDVIKTGGEWISSLTLENLISQHPGVSEVAVIGLPHPEWGERPCALVVLKDKQTKGEDIQIHLQQFVAQGKIHKWAIPEVIEFVDAIPKTSVGKIDKKKIRAEKIQ
ncbi:fatty acid--CoA ligase [Zooshikella ganghwensis]|uniref:Fatty acid--CoA ligase n=1 Tax=Zooshikella ganghwensis TaxID=202772 RepID=A0A4P9VTT8_9GAMM|nr:fatty acid--CoA ligase [Zooshikella ganghwensis]RDH45460.1 fatty acid--CoA ligase [Zooshikella ganghwensis]